MLLETEKGVIATWTAVLVVPREDKIPEVLAKVFRPDIVLKDALFVLRVDLETLVLADVGFVVPVEEGVVVDEVVGRRH